MRYEKFESFVIIAIAAAFAVVQVHFAVAAAKGAMAAATVVAEPSHMAAMTVHGMSGSAERVRS
jgi:hypothetical protein